jgi:hypothetical protein
MKHKFTTLLKCLFIGLLLTLFNPFTANASHVTGAEWTYKLVGPNLYEVTLVIYRDPAGNQLCGGCAAPGTSPGACPQTIAITGAAGACNGTSFGTQTLNYVSSEPVIDVVELCANVSTISRNCNTRTPGTFQPGTERYIFRGNINLSTLPTNCCQVSLSINICCRNNAITTITNPGSQNLYSMLTINRCITPVGNSSPRFALPPDVLFKAGLDVLVNNGVFDDEGDSISINLGTALSNGAAVPYVNPYSTNAPFPYLGIPGQSPPLLAPSGIQIFPLSGDVRFRPQGAFVSNLILEYGEWRKINGVYQRLSTVRRETQVYSQTASANSNPSFRMYSDNGSFATASALVDTIRICPGQSYCRIFGLNDNDIADTTDINWVMDSAMIKSGATITRMFNAATRNTLGPRFDSVKFCWTPSLNEQRGLPYLLVLTGKDRVCPIPSKYKKSTVFYVGSGDKPTILKTRLSSNSFKFKHSLSDTSKYNPLLTQWNIENQPGSNTFTNLSGDSINTQVFSGVGGWYRIKVTIPYKTCNAIIINDSVFISKSTISVNGKANINCKGDSSGSVSVSLTGGLMPISFRIGSSNWQTSGTFNKLIAGNYWVYGRDSLQSLDSIQVNILQPDSVLSLSLVSQQNIVCRGDSTGSLVFRVIGGTRPYKFIFNNDSSFLSSSFTNLKVGTYQLIVLDSLGCRRTLNATLTQPNTVFNASATLVQKKCFSDLGSITIVPSGGNSPYFYAINNGSLLTNPTFSNLNHGVYALKARDFNGCERNFTRVIDTVTQVLVNATKTEPSCGLSNGSIRLSGSGGKAPYRYKFGSGAYGKDSLFINLTSGTYAVSVIDTNGCVTNSNILLNSATPINLSLSSTPESCNGANDGTASAIASGGSLPYTYQWNSNPIQTSAKASGLKAAWYTLRLTDASSCTKLDSVQVMQKATILAQPLCIISTDTLFNYSVLAWQKNAGLGIAAYNIYRSNTSTGPWSLIHTHPFALPALVADTTLPITTSRAFYQITALDSCNIESSASVAHRGLLLTRTAVGSAQKLDWTAYVGGNVGTSFDVYRRTNGGGFFSIASLPITTRTYTDSSIIAGSKEYIIEMNWTGSCAGAPSSRIISNKVTVNSTGLVQAAGLNTKLLVYPNPAKGVLFVETENRLAQILKVEMYSLSGVLVGSKESNSANKITLEISDLAKGMYLLKVKLENGTTETMSVLVEN